MSSFAHVVFDHTISAFDRIHALFITALVALLVHSQQNRFSRTSVIYYSIIMVKSKI